MRGNPDLAPTVAPFWAQTLDFPGSDKFAQAMAAMAPPPVKAIIQPEGNDKGPDPAALAQELDQCKQALNEAIGHAHAAQQDADQANQEANEQKQLGQVRERELNIESYKAETDRLKVTGANDEQIQAIVQDLLNSMVQQPTPMPPLANESGPTESGGGIANVDPTQMNASAVGQSPAMPNTAQGFADGGPVEKEPDPKLLELEGKIKRIDESLSRADALRLSDLIQSLIEAVKKPRIRIPVKNDDGTIKHVIDKPEE
jgi:hypothetical protein